jgi:photosystem II stability/assembly factor-like uncharacterized protein
MILCRNVGAPLWRASWNRFARLGLAALAMSIAVSVSAAAVTPTGVYQLDHEAITIKDPLHTPLVGVTTAGKRLVAVGQHGVVLLSDDNGVSWRQANVSVDVLLTDVYFTTDKEGWAVGHYGVVLHTDDGGENWTRVVDGLDIIAAEHADATMPEPGDVMSADLMQRVDTAYTAAGPSKPVLAIGGCGNGILAAGQQNLAMFKDENADGWVEWTSKIPNQTFNNIYDIASDGGKTLLVGEFGMLLQSQSGCTSFKQISVPSTGTLFGILVVRPGTFYVYGVGGALFGTTDDGVTWTSFALPPDQIVDAAVVLKNGKILLGTVNGALYLSDQNGANYRPLASRFVSVAALTLGPNGNVVVVGEGGINVIGADTL